MDPVVVVAFNIIICCNNRGSAVGSTRRMDDQQQLAVQPLSSAHIPQYARRVREHVRRWCDAQGLASASKSHASIIANTQRIACFVQQLNGRSSGSDADYAMRR